MSKKKRQLAIEARFQTNRSLRRRQGNRPPRRCILIVCEGEKTEPLYFRSLGKALELSLVEVEIKPAGGAPITVVDYALTLRENRKGEVRKAQRRGEFGPPVYDEVWCVFDTERFIHNSSFFPAIDKAHGNRVDTAISNPAFEYWYLLHFAETDRLFCGPSEVIQELEKYIGPYAKSLDVFPLLADRTTEAIKRAERILQRYSGTDRFPTPSTFVHRLVQKMCDMARCK